MTKFALFALAFGMMATAPVYYFYQKADAAPSLSVTAPAMAADTDAGMATPD